MGRGNWCPHEGLMHGTEYLYVDFCGEGYDENENFDVDLWEGWLEDLYAEVKTAVSPVYGASNRTFIRGCDIGVECNICPDIYLGYADNQSSIVIAVFALEEELVSRYYNLEDEEYNAYLDELQANIHEYYLKIMVYLFDLGYELYLRSGAWTSSVVGQEQIEELRKGLVNV